MEGVIKTYHSKPIAGKPELYGANIGDNAIILNANDEINVFVKTPSIARCFKCT